MAFYRFGVGDDTVEFRDILDDPILGLGILGFLQRVGEGKSGAIFLTEKAYVWAKYQRQGVVGRWMDRSARLGQTVLQSVFGILLALVGFMTAVLTLLQALGWF